MRRSRLSKNLEKKTKKTMILSIIGIVIIIFFLLKFGVELLVNFSLFISGSRGQANTASSQNQINFIAPPVLNPLPNATNSAQIVISGKSSNNKTINLYVNNNKTDQVQTDSNGNFTFSENLNSGDNQIKVNAQENKKVSDFSETFDVVFKNSQPTLDVSSPSDGQHFTKDQNTVVVSGKTDQGVTITVNGFWAVIDDNNNFSYTLPLQNGDNQIKIVAVDQAGNKIEKDLSVNYSQ